MRARPRDHTKLPALVEDDSGVRASSTVRLRPSGFGATAFASFAPQPLVLACRAEAREASEGWWGRQDSNLRSHKAADLQSAPFATRDTPPLDGSTIGPDLAGGPKTAMET